MNKYNIGQKVYWIKYTDDKPDVRTFEIAYIRQTKNGYQYQPEPPGSVYVPEEKIFETIEDAILNGCHLLEECKWYVDEGQDE